MNTQSPTDRNANASSGTPSPVMQLRIHLVDGSVQSFSQADHAKAEQTWLSIEPARLFAQPRLVIAGTHSKSVFVCSEILRIDFVQQCFRCWHFPEVTPMSWNFRKQPFERMRISIIRS